MVGKGKLAVFESSNISETEEGMPMHPPRVDSCHEYPSGELGESQLARRIAINQIAHVSYIRLCIFEVLNFRDFCISYACDEN